MSKAWVKSGLFSLRFSLASVYMETDLTPLVDALADSVEEGAVGAD